MSLNGDEEDLDEYLEADWDPETERKATRSPKGRETLGRVLSPPRVAAPPPTEGGEPSTEEEGEGLPEEEDESFDFLSDYNSDNEEEEEILSDFDSDLESEEEMPMTKVSSKLKIPPPKTPIVVASKTASSRLPASISIPPPPTSSGALPPKPSLPIISKATLVPKPFTPITTTPAPAPSTSITTTPGPRKVPILAPRKVIPTGPISSTSSTSGPPQSKDLEQAIVQSQGESEELFQARKKIAYSLLAKALPTDTTEGIIRDSRFLAQKTQTGVTFDPEVEMRLGSWLQRLYI